jgi:hypothetical protein
LLHPNVDVPGELFFGVLLRLFLPQIALYFDYRGACFHIDAPAVADRRFEIHILEIARFKLKRGGEDELADICLNFRLGPLRIADGKSLKSIKQAASLID